MKYSAADSNLALTNQRLKRLIYMSAALLLLVVTAFGGYYYWDRYVHVGDRSPLEMGATSMEAMVRENPQDVEARLALAQYYFDSGGYAEAIALSEEILGAYPDQDGALLIAGVSYAMSDQPKAAAEALGRFADRRDGAAMSGSDRMLETALYFLGESRNRMNQPDLAIDALNKALRIDRADADAMYQLGVAYGLKGEPALAAAQYQLATRFVPDFSEAYQGMIASYTALGQPAHAAYAQGMAAFCRRDFERARSELEWAIGELPYFPPAALGLGLLHEQLGDLVTAEAYLARAVALEPDDFMISNALYRVQTALGKSPQAAPP